MTEQELGRVQRQEAVSMVPPLLLEVRRGMAVLTLTLTLTLSLTLPLPLGGATRR